MAREYSPVEAALVTRLVAHFSTELSDSRCKAGELDSVFDAVFYENADYGCLIEYGGGKPEDRPPFSKPVWAWTFFGIFFIRYDDQIETKLRTIVDKLVSVFDQDHTLGNISPLVWLADMGEADPGEVNDIAFYWLPFTIQAVVR